MALQTANQYNLQPDVAGSLLGGFKAGQQISQKMGEQERQAQFRQLSGVLTDPQASPEQKMQAQSQLMSINPERAIAVRQQLTKSLSQEELASARDMARGAVEIDAIQTPEGRLQAARNRKQRLIEEKKPTLETDQLIEALESGNYDLAQQMLNKGKQAGQILGVLETGTGVGMADQGPSAVQSAKILEDGTVQIVRKDGSVEIKPPSDIEAEIIARAKDVGVEIQQKRAQGRGLGKDAAKQSSAAIDQIQGIRSNNATLKQVVEEVKGGAETGPLADRLPSFRAATVKLNQLKNKLGLDVVGSVTFGALSEGELKLALNTALPTNLQGPELVQWAEDKIEAQEKLARYLEDQAIFLADPGNSRADWIKLQKEQAKEAPQSGATVQPAQTGAQPQAAPRFLGFE